MELHVMPVNDLKEHFTESACECCPKLKLVEGNMVFTHNSYDGRELVEQLIDELNK